MMIIKGGRRKALNQVFREPNISVYYFEIDSSESVENTNYYSSRVDRANMNSWRTKINKRILRIEKVNFYLH